MKKDECLCIGGTVICDTKKDCKEFEKEYYEGI